MNRCIKLLTIVPTAFVLAILAFTLTLCAQDHNSGHWAYDGAAGPGHWADLNPEFAVCGSGHRQSPIDIRNPRKVNLPNLQVKYKQSPLRIVDNGHTIQVNYAPGSSITVGGKSYELVQFHFHRPSEEEINGRRYAMVVHLVHRNEEGELAVVAVLIKEGNPNQLISTLWDNLPSEKGKELDPEHVDINVTDLLPANHKYYTFAGSLTTPPCSEGVTWYVLETPMSLSKEQIEKFAGIYPLNERPIQPLDDRIVEESK